MTVLNLFLTVANSNLRNTIPGIIYRSTEKRLNHFLYWISNCFETVHQESKGVSLADDFSVNLITKTKHGTQRAIASMSVSPFDPLTDEPKRQG